MKLRNKIQFFLRESIGRKQEKPGSVHQGLASNIRGMQENVSEWGNSRLPGTMVRTKSNICKRLYSKRSKTFIFKYCLNIGHRKQLQVSTYNRKRIFTQPCFGKLSEATEINIASKLKNQGWSKLNDEVLLQYWSLVAIRSFNVEWKENLHTTFFWKSLGSNWN